ncbi:hypothetical protein EDB19DRAFT_349588 [Suillus lakei]|nr:hypothetical protein EDB19DRAFT_349588 [Suillus lakei]
MFQLWRLQSAIKLLTAPRQGLLLATIVAWRVMSLVIARWKPRPSLATNVVKRVTFLAIAPTLVQAVVVVAAAAAAMVGDSLDPLVRSATAAASPATLPAHVLRLQEATLATVAEAVMVLLVEEAPRLAIPAVVWVICRATAFKVLSVITVRAWVTSAVTAPNLRGAPATRVVQRVTFLVTVPVLPLLRMLECCDIHVFLAA